jgi:predicted nucleic acid-binding protein
LVSPIKETAIELKQRYKTKLPDAVIASTALYLDIPLITFDKGFSKFEEINTLLLEV